MASSDAFELRVKKKLVFSLVVLALVLSVLEVGQRISDWRKEAKRSLPPDSLRFETTRGHAITDRRGAIVMTLDPHLLFRPRPNQSSGAVTINSQGFRGRDWKKKKPPGTARVAVLGGSSVFGLWASSDETTIPAQLERELAKAAPGRSFEVLNAGINAFDSLQELILLESEVLDQEPDLVIVLDGWNDFYNAGHVPPDRPLPWHRQFEDLEEVIERGDQPFRNVLRLSAFYRGLERRIDDLRASAPRALADHPDGVPRYRKHLELASRLALAKGSRVLLVSQPEISQRSALAESERVFLETKAEPSYAAYARSSYPAYVLASKEAAEAAGATHCDATKAFDSLPEPVFVDWVHTNDRGNEVLAKHLAPLVLQALERR